MTRARPRPGGAPLLLLGLALVFGPGPSARADAAPSSRADAAPSSRPAQSAARPAAQSASRPAAQSAARPAARAAMPRYEAVVRGRRPSAAVTRSLLGANELALRGARNVPQALETEPSVEIQRSPKAGGTLQVRGFDENAVLVTVDGIPLRESYGGHFDITALPVFALGSIVLERGVTSLLHGPNSSGGVLRLESPRRCASLLDVAGFAGRPYAGGLLLGGVAGRACLRASDLTVQLAGGYEHAGGHLLASSYRPTPETAPFHEDGGLRAGSDYDRATFSLSARYAPRHEKSVTLFINALRAPRGIPPFESSGYVRYWRFTRYDSLLVGLAATYGPEPARVPLRWGLRALRARLYLHLHRDELRDYEDARYERSTTNPLAWFVASAYANESYGAVVEASWSLFARNRLELALRYHIDVHRQRELPVPRAGAETSWTTWERYAAHTLTVALEDQQQLGAWRLEAGVSASGLALLAQQVRDTSYPVDPRIIPAVEGRLALVRSVGQSLRLVAAAGHKVRYPLLKELFSNALGGNAALRAERVWLGELGFDSEHASRRVALSARVYLNAIEDLISRYRDAYANIGRAVTSGVEVTVRYRPIATVELSAGYRFLYTRDLVNDHPLEYRTPQRATLRARLLDLYGLAGAIDLHGGSGQQAQYVDGLSGGWVYQRLPPFLLLGARLRYRFALGARLEPYVFADARNLLDANYHRGSFEPRPGRELLLGLGGRI